MKLSIITINLNNKAGLERTVLSVIQQSYTDFEYIIIDGGSDDGSQGIIKESEKRITYWVSEKDKGIYNAMNKGIFKANGDYCLFINSGDIFTKSTILDEMISYINDEDILYGNGFFKAKNNALEKLECPENLTLGFFTLYCLLHPCTLIRKSLFDKYGLYNESNKIISDYEFFIETVILNKVKTKFIPLDIAIAEDNGISRRPESQLLVENERRIVLQKQFPSYVIDLMNAYKEITISNMQINYEKNILHNEIQIYKRNSFFRAVLKVMRFVSRTIYN